MALLTFEGVDMSHQDGRRSLPVLRGVSLEVDEGDFVGIWGERRSGKSTLLRIAAGRTAPDQGAVRFDGEDLVGMSRERRAQLLRHRGIGFVSPDWRLERNAPVVDHVALALLSDGMTMREARTPALHALERVGAMSCAHLLVGRLSHAERMRVALAHALVQDPRLLILDEPAAVLRQSEYVLLLELLSTLGADPRIAVMVASEDMATIRAARRLMSIGSGHVRSMDPPGTVMPFPQIARIGKR